MLTGRGWALLAAGFLMWVGARLTGSADLHIVAVGVVLLVPLTAALMRWNRHRLRATRRLSHRRAFVGSQVRVSVEVQNLTRSRTSVMLLEDRLPAALGRGARAVLGGLRPRSRQTVVYTLRCPRRGRYRIGPLVASITDPFGLARQRVAFPDLHELLVYPEVEDLRHLPVRRSSGGSGETTARQLQRAGEEFYTMREYQIGDDLRRIHWPSTARTGELMIRQDEAGRRASATLFFDGRAFAYGSPGGFERAVSAAASVGSLYIRGGINLSLATTEMPPMRVRGDAFLEALATLTASQNRSLAHALRWLRDRAATGSSLIVVTHLLDEGELDSLLQATGVYGHKLAVLVDQRVADPEADPVRGVRLLLARAGWETMLLPPDQSLQQVWAHRGKRRIRTGARS